MSDHPEVIYQGEMEEFHISKGETPRTLLLDVFRWRNGKQMSFRYRMSEDRAKELLRQLAAHLAVEGTLELPPRGPTKLQ